MTMQNYYYNTSNMHPIILIVIILAIGVIIHYAMPNRKRQQYIVRYVTPTPTNHHVPSITYDNTFRVADLECKNCNDDCQPPWMPIGGFDKEIKANGNVFDFDDQIV